MIRTLPFILVGVIFVEFVVTNHLAGLGSNVGELDAHIAKLREENELLAQEVASASSLITLSAKAKSFGYVEPTHYLTVGPQQFPVALGENR